LSRYRILNLCQSHRRMIPPPTPRFDSTDGNYHVSERFPATIELTGLGRISDALVGRADWDPGVLTELRDFLRSTSQEKIAFLKNCESDTTERAIEALELYFELECQAYSDKSFTKVKVTEEARLDLLDLKQKRSWKSTNQT
jgi:hypothetical protein